MNRIAVRTFVATLRCYSTASEGLGDLACRGCREPLDIHQPDPNQPDQFLGTCPKCGRWHRVESTVEGGKLNVLELPEVREAYPPSPDGTHR